ncbi:MAG: NTP transferase domain-containing protein [Myxococcales bacterium]
MALLVTLAGLFVGGASRRMGGFPKGLLPTRDAPSIFHRTTHLLETLGLPWVGVGSHHAYENHQRFLSDEPPDIGPLGGLCPLLRAAAVVICGGSANASPHTLQPKTTVLAIACDMPFLTEAIVRRLVESPCASVLAPRRQGRWEPLFALYDVSTVLPVALARAQSRQLSLQGLLDAVGAAEFPLCDGELDLLHDWDKPEDL